MHLLPVPVQISDHLEVPREAPDTEQIAALKEVVAIGETFWCKVIDVKEPDASGKPRISCSIKVVRALSALSV